MGDGGAAQRPATTPWLEGQREVRGWSREVGRILEPHQAHPEGFGATHSEETFPLLDTVWGTAWGQLASPFPALLWSACASHWQNPASSQLTSGPTKCRWKPDPLRCRTGEGQRKDMRQTGPAPVQVTTHYYVGPAARAGLLQPWPQAPPQTVLRAAGLCGRLCSTV